jgi:hypothetical protein
MIAIAQISVFVDLDKIGMPADTQVENDYHFSKSFVRSVLIDELKERLYDPDDTSIDELIGYRIVSSIEQLQEIDNPN